MIKFYSGNYNLNQMIVFKHALLEAKMNICYHSDFDCKKCKNKRICNDISRLIDYLENEISSFFPVENSVETVDN